ncbi:hypothetical protein NliqN6_2344 [Naganishia liquefaciens]|uniref:UBR-type domain-containing protein n=1 Tax=Naganishia liquefaciens TaxID=104408 RepID=A0A8H3TRN5_9TREE|nr:hypothetical protein NliqN6_2344 [Naganishia liquefaciens]
MSRPSPAPDSITTLPAHLDAQAALRREAHDWMPYRVDQCSYARGPLRQRISSCRTCGTEDAPVGVCDACAVSCHAEHDLVELFTRRDFTCDCPTSHRARCALLGAAQPRNTGNTYGRNFLGEFCRCERGKRYDPMDEAESMIECLACQDWFHESCLNLQDPCNPIPADTDTSSTTSSSTIESPLLPSTAYAHLVCSGCITAHPLLQRYAGTQGWCMVVPRENVDPAAAPEWAERWDVIGRREPSPPSSTKRARSPHGSPLVKRPRLSSSSPTATPPTPTSAAPKPCTLPAPNPLAQRILASFAASAAANADAAVPPSSSARARGDVFLLPSARENICTCASCMPDVQTLPFPLEDEPEYEPVEDSPGTLPCPPPPLVGFPLIPSPA